MVQGKWLVMSRADDGAAERLVAFDAIALIEVVDVALAVKDVDLARSAAL